MEKNLDIGVDECLEKCVSKDTRKSFFLFAGAGSGKTYSLVKLLKRIKEKWGKQFAMEGKHVAVVTYTNAATDEINRRLDFDSLFQISTIHSFLWNVIQPYQSDIKAFRIHFLREEVKNLTDKINNAKNKENQTCQRNKEKLDKIKQDIEKTAEIEKFLYNPNGNNFEFDTLSHADVLKIGSSMIKEKKLLQQIIAQQYPFLLVDESQDTNKEVIKAFFEIEKSFAQVFTLGLFGDQKQRIYTDGEENITDKIPNEWEKPVKRMNYRSDKRIIELINKIGLSIGSYAAQEAKKNAKEGFVRLFLASENADKARVEEEVNSKMAIVTKDTRWSNGKDVKKLTLEHMMAAKRLGFADFLKEMKNVPKYQQTLLQGKARTFDLFSKQLFPLYNFLINGNHTEALVLLKKFSPCLQADSESQAIKQISECRQAVNQLKAIDFEKNTVRDLVELVRNSRLFRIPDCIIKALSFNANEQDADEEKEVQAWSKVMDLPVIQIKIFDDYVSGKTIYDTHQGVKGLEYDRVMVIIDDNDAIGNTFSYDKLFGVKPLSGKDEKNINDGKEDSKTRTKRLFYVTCSRARHSLAVLMYTSNIEQAKKEAINNEWFRENEVVVIE